MAWTVQFLSEDVRRELEAFPKDILASFLRISRLEQIQEKWKPLFRPDLRLTKELERFRESRKRSD